MKKNCETCKHEDNQYYAYPFKVPCDKCVTVKGSDIPSEWEAAEHYTPDTNADRIRAMSDEELAKFLVSVENRRRGNDFGAVWHLPYVALEWLQQPAEGE